MLSRAKRLAYGLSTALLRWYYRSCWGMDIGKGVLIARSAKLDQTNPKGVKIGDYTAVALNSVILTHDFINGPNADVSIGSHCFIGAGSVIMPGATIGDHCIVGPGSVVFGVVPSNSAILGNPARIIERGIVTGKWGIRNPKFLEQEGVIATVKKSTPFQELRTGSADLLSSYLPNIADPRRPFGELGIDSFTLVTLRAEIEETEGSAISDEDWVAIERPLDLLRFMTKPKDQRFGEVVGATARRSYEINMPQMALGGLSEGWLFKEVGDIHWALLTSALGVKSREISDQAGDRLYATFTRIRYTSVTPLAEISENDRMDAAAAMTRYGAGLFFSSVQFAAPKTTLNFEVMSSFSKFGESGENTSLVKGQPVLPDAFAVPSVPELPTLAVEYRDLRSTKLEKPIFETEYEIVPQHDINGVGLLYFAAYPVIADICLMRFLGPCAALSWSPVSRDICYFANSGVSERLIYHLYRDEEVVGRRRFTGTLSRASSGKMMALCTVEMAGMGASRPRQDPNLRPSTDALSV